MGCSWEPRQGRLVSSYKESSQQAKFLSHQWYLFASFPPPNHQRLRAPAMGFACECASCLGVSDTHSVFKELSRNRNQSCITRNRREFYPGCHTTMLPWQGTDLTFESLSVQIKPDSHNMFIICSHNPVESNIHSDVCIVSSELHSHTHTLKPTVNLFHWHQTTYTSHFFWNWCIPHLYCFHKHRERSKC